MKEQNPRKIGIHHRRCSRIGEASVRKFAAEGWKVTFMDIDREKGDALAAEYGSNVIFEEGDTRSRMDIKRAVASATEHFGGIDAVFANAGIHRSNTLLDISDEELDMILQINIIGTVNTLQEAVPAIIARGGGAVVINASDQCLVGKARSFAYGMTKGALGQITRSLAIDLGRQGVRVNAVCPGQYIPLWSTAFSPAVQPATAAYALSKNTWRKRTLCSSADAWAKPEKWQGLSTSSHRTRHRSAPEVFILSTAD